MNGQHSAAYKKQIKEAKARLKKAEKERKQELKHQRMLESLRKKTEKNIAHAEHQESLARRRQARKKALKAHPLGFGKRSALGKNVIKVKKGKPWYDL